MNSNPERVSRQVDDNEVIRLIFEGTAVHHGGRLFRSLVENLATALGTVGAWVTEYLPEQRRLRALSFRLEQEFIRDCEYDISGTPCEQVISERQLVHFPDRLTDHFPDLPGFLPRNAVSYLGIPLLDTDSAVLGHLAVMHTSPLPRQPRREWLMYIFASRTAAELRYLRARTDNHRRESTPTSSHIDRPRAAQMPGDPSNGSGRESTASKSASSAVMTIDELRELERTNMIRALEHCRWKISGSSGAAALIGVPPSTLASRMKALKIFRPR